MFHSTFHEVVPNITFYKVLASHKDMSLNDGSRGCKKCSSKIEISSKDREGAITKRLTDGFNRSLGSLLLLSALERRRLAALLLLLK